MAAREFPNEDAVGRQITARLAGKLVEFEVVGVAKDVKFGGLRALPAPAMYLPYGRYGRELGATLAIRTSRPQGEVREAIRAVLQSRLPSTAIEVRALGAQVSATLVRERMMATLATGFGVLALVLASVGLYGLLAYGVAQRSREIGIRMALGAKSSSVISLILLNGARLVAIGLLIGYPAAWAASRSVQSLLFGLKPSDPGTLVAAAGALIVAAGMASYLPARRAARVNPVDVLRGE
jgi:ABC-type antimicrobial peptide transport system permease subunit